MFLKICAILLTLMNGCVYFLMTKFWIRTSFKSKSIPLEKPATKHKKVKKDNFTTPLQLFNEKYTVIFKDAEEQMRF